MKCPPSIRLLVLSVGSLLVPFVADLCFSCISTTLVVAGLFLMFKTLNKHDIEITAMS